MCTGQFILKLYSPMCHHHSHDRKHLNIPQSSLVNPTLHTNTLASTQHFETLKTSRFLRHYEFDFHLATSTAGHLEEDWELYSVEF